MDWSLSEEIPVRVGALRQAESIWMVEWKSLRTAGEKWKKEHPEAFELRKELVAAFKFAYRNNPNVLTRLKNILSGSKAFTARIQGLNDLSVLGKQHPAELKAMNFDLKLLEQSAAYSDKMSDLYSDFSAENKYSETKKIRDQAYTFLKIPVDKLKEVGRYLYRNDKNNKERFNQTDGVKKTKTTISDIADEDEDI